MRFFKKPAIHLFWILAIWHVLPGISDTVAGQVDGIHYDKITDALTVNVREMPLSEVLQKIGAKSGIKFSIEAGIDRLVTMDLTAIPVDKAINRLIQPSSSALIYSKREDGVVVLTSVKIFDNKGGSPSSSTANPSPLRRFNGRNDPSIYSNTNPADGRFSGAAGAGRTAGDNAGNNGRGRGRQGVDRIVPDSDSQGDIAGSVQSALDAFSSGSMRHGR